MSENSSARTWVTRALTAETISGNRSVMPPGWMPVPCSVDAALAAGGLERLDLRRVGVDPAERRHHVLARAQERGDLVVVRHQRAVDDAVGVEGEDLLGAGRSRRRRPGSVPRISPTSLPSLSAECTQHPTSSRSGWLEHPLDRRPAHAAGRPLHDPDGRLGRALALVTRAIQPTLLTRVKTPGGRVVVTRLSNADSRGYSSAATPTRRGQGASTGQMLPQASTS